MEPLQQNVDEMWNGAYASADAKYKALADANDKALADAKANGVENPVLIGGRASRRRSHKKRRHARKSRKSRKYRKSRKSRN